MTTEYDKLLEEQAVQTTDEAFGPEEDGDIVTDDDGLEQEEVADGDLDVEDTSDEEEIDAPAEAASGKPAKEKKPEKPKRGDLPEGYVTPVGLAKIITENKLHVSADFPDGMEDGKPRVCPPQVVYSYMKNAPKEHPFPIEEIEDSNGQKRQALKVDAGLAWWREKNERVAARAQNAAEKAKKAADKAAAKASGGSTTTSEAPAEPEGEVVEAE